MATKLIFKNMEDYRRSLKPEVYAEESPAEIRQNERERIRHEYRMKELSKKQMIEMMKGRLKEPKKVKKGIRAPVPIKSRYVAPVQKFAQQLFPQVPMSMPSYPVQSRIYQGKKGRPARGRPYGSFKYGMPISEYKRMMRAAKSRARAQQMMALNVARARQGMQRQIYRQMPQMPQQYPPQGAMPQQGPPQKPGFFERGLFKHNLFGQGGPPRQVYRREAPVYYPEQQYPQAQEMPVYSNGPVEYESKTSPTQQVVYQRPPQREIVPVFKSSGGHPYTPVPQERPIANSPNTEYYEDRDLMTGKMIIKRRPQAEAWIR